MQRTASSMLGVTEPLLFILAMDQRDSIEQKLYELKSAPTPEQSASIAANKLLVYRGLLDAVPGAAGAGAVRASSSTSSTAPHRRCSPPPTRA